MSEKKHTGGSVFPWSGGDPRDGSEGISLRDYFASQAVIALGAHKAVVNRGIPWLAQHAYMVADAMLEARK